MRSRKQRPRFGGDDLIALVTIVFCFILIARGHDGVVTSVLLTVIGYYFGQKTAQLNK